MNSQKTIVLSLVILLISICSFPVFHTQAIEEIQNVPSQNEATRNVRVGFFKFTGYHNIDEYGNRSGYGYEYIHEMAKYTGWIFTYVDGTWEECQEMLKNGEIDLLTSAHRTEELEQDFDFSTLPIGEKYAQLTVKNDNLHFTKNDFKCFNNMRIGILGNNSRKPLFEKFAKSNGFSYKGVNFLDVEGLNLALQNGTIDAILKDCLRKSYNERVIARFAPLPFYAIVQKENTTLLSEINVAIAKINIKNPNYEVMLYDKYYSPALSSNTTLTVKEIEYLKNKPTLRVVGPHATDPLFDCRGGVVKGITVDILKLIAKSTDTEMEFLHAENYAQAVSMVKNGEAEILAFFQSDFNWAEQNGIRITSPYMSLDYSAISRFQFTGELQRIAVINGFLIDSKYIESTYKNPVIIVLDTEEDAVRAVDKKEADVALIHSYSAQKLLYPTYPDLKATAINVHSDEISLGVSAHMDSILYNILDKELHSLDQIVISKIIADHTVLQAHRLTLLESMMLNPIILIVMLGCALIFIILLLIYRGFIQRRYATKIFNLAYYDTFTNSWNRNGFELKTKERLQNTKGNCAIISLDIEGFSAINSDYSREVGDMVIVKVAQHLQLSCGKDAIIAHAHADNYLLFIEYTKESDFEKKLDAICNLAPISTDNDSLFKLNTRAGVCKIENMNMQSFNTAFARSEMAHQVAKKQILSVVYFDENLKLRMEQEKKIIDCFKQALENGDFQVYYQPKVDMRNGKIIGAEGLIRWEHKELGFLSPNKFIPLLERTGDVVEIDFFVFEQVCIMIRNWIDTSFPLIPISVNQSRANFARSKYIERIQNLLEKYNIPRNAIEMEITENLFESQKVVQEMIEQIKNIGLCVSMDDFGSGYSSLALLKQVSIDTIKIDKSLIDDSESSMKARKILRKIVEMAYDLGLNVICEGVEHKEQSEFLLEIGCKYAQGFLYSKPVCKKDFLALLNK